MKHYAKLAGTPIEKARFHTLKHSRAKRSIGGRELYSYSPYAPASISCFLHAVILSLNVCKEADGKWHPMLA